MTTTFPAPAAVSAPAPAASVAAASVAAALRSGCAVEQRALRTAARDLADALLGIAFDAPCRPARQRAILDFSAGVMRVVQAGATRSGEVPLHRACAAVAAATPVFAGNISAGAPGLAAAWIALADLLDAQTGAGHDHTVEELLACERRFRSAVQPTSFGVPWFVDACSPRERVLLVRFAPRRVRLALRLGEDRWTDLRDAVRGC